MATENPPAGRRGSDPSLDRVLSAFDGDEPMMTEEIQDRFDIPRRTAVDKLEQLHERGELERKRVGDRVAIWWRPAQDDPEAPGIEVEVVPDGSGTAT